MQSTISSSPIQFYNFILKTPTDFFQQKKTELGPESQKFRETFFRRKSTGWWSRRSTDPKTPGFTKPCFRFRAKNRTCTNRNTSERSIWKVSFPDSGRRPSCPAVGRSPSIIRWAATRCSTCGTGPPSTTTTKLTTTNSAPSSSKVAWHWYF